MTNYAVISKTSLLPDPDVSSVELLSLDVGDIVASLCHFEALLKVVFTDKVGVTHSGWVRPESLKALPAQQFQLYNDVFAQAITVFGDLIEVRVTLYRWRKVRIRCQDGSLVEGWIHNEPCRDSSRLRYIGGDARRPLDTDSVQGEILNR